MFSDLVSRADADINLPAAALAIARLRYPDLDVGMYLDEMAEIGRDAHMMVSRYSESDPLAVLNVLLFEEQGFDGDRENYYDPRNSLLNDVLDRRRGIPITLALVYIEAGRAAGVEIRGVGFPGHFLVCHPVTGRYVDVFNQGRLLDRVAFLDLLRRQGVGPEGWRDDFLQPVGNAQMLARMLNNLRRHYAQQADQPALEILGSMSQALQFAREPGIVSMIH
ncbi:MAG: hypothetical protein HY899_05865 [Deltaproteobacteria bacterium]|nr:hypothetical protein [Deltaproteobacteria bacterium]